MNPPSHKGIKLPDYGWLMGDPMIPGVGGVLGTLLAGVFCSPALGIFSGQGFGGEIASIGAQMKVQLIGVVVTIVYTAVLTWGIFKVVALMTNGLRVDRDEERQGLDIISHEERGYDL